MKKKYLSMTAIVFICTIFQMVSLRAFANSGAFNFDSTKTFIKLKDNRANKPIFSTSIGSTEFESFMLKIAAIKADAPTSKNLTSPKTLNSAVTDVQKSLDNVKVYPNPVSTQINLSYTLNKEYMVTIKVLDVLGNEVATLLNQKVAAGDQTNSFNLGTKLNSGLYFVRVVAGSESVIKRISVL